MQDRVAEILHERASVHNGAASGAFFSILLHAALVSGAFYAAHHQTPPKPASIIDIRFARAASAPVVPAAPLAAPPKPATLQEPTPAIESKQPAAKPEPKTVPFSPFGRSTKKGSETPAPKPAAVPVAATGAAEVPIGAAGVTGLEGGDFPYTLYIERMKTIIGSRWLRPNVAAGTTTTVYFVIDRDGSIRDAKTESASVSGTFDRAALRAVLESSPLPPLPFGYSGTYLGVHLTFK